MSLLEQFSVFYKSQSSTQLSWFLQRYRGFIHLFFGIPLLRFKTGFHRPGFIIRWFFDIVLGSRWPVTG